MKNKEVYLTIDDSPSSHMNEKIDFLSRKKIPALFFCRGDLLEKRPSAAIRALKNGFVLGNHAYSHVPFSLLQEKNAIQQIKKTDTILSRLYKNARVEWRVKLFRFPYGDKGQGVAFFTRDGTPHGADYSRGKSKKKRLQHFLKSLGYVSPKFEGITYSYYKKYSLDTDIDSYWTYDFEEYRLEQNEIFARMNTKNLRQGGRLDRQQSRDVLLVHDHENTHNVFIAVLNQLIKKNVTFLLPKQYMEK